MHQTSTKCSRRSLSQTGNAKRQEPRVVYGQYTSVVALVKGVKQIVPLKDGIIVAVCEV